MYTVSHSRSNVVPAGLLVAVLAVSTSAILVRATAAPSLIAALYRVVFTVALLVPVAIGRGRTSLSGIERHTALGGVFAGVALALHFGAWFESLSWTSIAASVTLVQCQPAFVVLGAGLLLNETVTRRTVCGIAVALAGMVVLSGGVTAGGSLLGNGLAIGAAVLAACYVLAGRSLRQHTDLVGYVLIVYSVCAVTLFGIAIATNQPLTGYAPRDWLLFLAMAVGPGLLGHTVINWALAHVRSSVVSVSLLGEPVGATLLAVLLFGEYPTIETVVGGVIIIAGIAVTAISE